VDHALQLRAAAPEEPGLVHELRHRVYAQEPDQHQRSPPASCGRARRRQGLSGEGAWHGPHLLIALAVVLVLR